jgi:hypothetical protein
MLTLARHSASMARTADAVPTPRPRYSLHCGIHLLNRFYACQIAIYVPSITGVPLVISSSTSGMIHPSAGHTAKHDRGQRSPGGAFSGDFQGGRARLWRSFRPRAVRCSQPTEWLLRLGHARRDSPRGAFDTPREDRDAIVAPRLMVARQARPTTWAVRHPRSTSRSSRVSPTRGPLRAGADTHGEDAHLPRERTAKGGGRADTDHDRRRACEGRIRRPRALIRRAGRGDAPIPRAPRRC